MNTLISNIVINLRIFFTEFREVRQHHDFFTVCRTPSLACLVTLQPIDRYGPLLDASIIFSDILVVPQAMGLEVQMLEGKGPHFPCPLRTPSDLSRLILQVDVENVLGYVLDAITLTRHELQGRVPLFGFVGAPWTLMAYMIEGGGSKTLSKAKSWLLKYPAESHKLLDAITNVVVDFLVAQVKAGADGLLFLPYLLGERAPIWNANARGVYFGLNISHQQKHFVRATLEGILFEIYSIGKILEAHRNFDRIYINGAYASLPLWTQILTDMFGKTIHVNDNHDSVAMGTALLGLTQLGIYENLEAAAATVKSDETYHPNFQNHEIYMKYFKIFERLSYKLSDEFEEIVLLQQGF